MAKFPSVPQRLYAVTFGGGAFVIVGEGGEILTSRDGEYWATQNSGSSDTLTGVAWGNSGFVVIGDKGTILTSPDGLTWTKRNSGTIATLFSVGYGNDTFVVLGDESTILTSSDGIQWTRTNIGPEGMGTIAFGNGLFMGTSIDTDFPGKKQLGCRQTMVSSDGKIWRPVEHPPCPEQDWPIIFNGYKRGTASLTFGGGRFIATSVEGIYTSPDGSSWKSSSESNDLKSRYYGAAFGNGIFVAVGNGNATDTKGLGRTSSMSIATSKDANAWELTPTPPSRLIWGSLKSDKVFKGGDMSPRLKVIRLSQIDENSWTTPNKISMPGAVYGNAVVFRYSDQPALLSAKLVVLSSKDGITWTRLAPVKSDHPVLIVANHSQSAVNPDNGVAIELNGQTYKLNLTANLGQRLEIQASTNLVDWETLTTITNGADIIHYTDADAANYPMRFYRLKLP